MLPWTRVYNRILWSPDGTRLLRQSVFSETMDNKHEFSRHFSRSWMWRPARNFGSVSLPVAQIPCRAWSWSPDGKLLVIFEVAESGIAAKHNVQLWDSYTGTTLAILDREATSASSLNSNIDFSPDGQLLAVASGANEIYVWEVPKLPLAAGASPLRIAAPHLTLQRARKFTALAFSADGRELHQRGGNIDRHLGCNRS